MKKTVKTLMCIATAVLAIAACSKPEGEKKGNEEQKPSNNYPEDVTVSELISKDIVAGDPAAITIKGDGFSEEEDFIWVGWDENGETVYERVSNPSLDIRPTRISFGLQTTTDAKGKTVKVYLDRVPYEKMPITGEINVKAPEVKDGYVPDPQFLFEIQSKNPSVQDLVGSCGLLDPDGAAAMTYDPKSIDGWPFDFSWSTSEDWRGVELFSGLGTGEKLDAENGMMVVAWWSQAIKNVDFSQWMAPVQVRVSDCNLVESVICGPNMRGLVLQNDPELKRVDMHLSRFATWCSFSACSKVEYLDIRRCRDGVSGVDYNEFAGSSNYDFQGIADNAHILIDSHYLMGHYVPSQWTYIMDAWKRGATIDVYSCIKIEEKLGTVPMYSVDPTALVESDWICPEGADRGYSANNWKIDDPYTDMDESASAE